MNLEPEVQGSFALTTKSIDKAGEVYNSNITFNATFLPNGVTMCHFLHARWIFIHSAQGDGIKAAKSALFMWFKVENIVKILLMDG